MVHAPIVPQLREAPMLIRTASDAVPVQPAAWHDVHGAASTLALALLYPSNSLRAFPAVELNRRDQMDLQGPRSCELVGFIRRTNEKLKGLVFRFFELSSGNLKIELLPPP